MEEKLPRKIEKPWGYELLFAQTAKYAGKVMFIEKGHRTSLQHHKKKDETMYIFEGKVLLEIERDGRMTQSEVSKGACFRFPPRAKHRLTAIEDTLLFEVSTPELEDVVRLADDYGRVKPEN